MDGIQIRSIIRGILNAENITKGELGRRFAAHLGLEPGPLGADGGIDGVGWLDDRKIYFQSKLVSQPLDASQADNLYANLVRHKANTAVVLAGVGYTKGFKSRLTEFYDIHRFKIHLLSLDDYFKETLAFQNAKKDLPTLRNLAFEKWF